MKYFILFFLFTETLSAQVAVSYYPFQSVVSLSTDTEKKIWGDLRVETNTFFGNLNTQLSAMYNFKQKPQVNYYGGLGLNINPFNGFYDISILNGYLLHLGTRIKPLKAYPNAQLLFELSPYINSAFDGGILRTHLGLGYNF